MFEKIKNNYVDWSIKEIWQLLWIRQRRNTYIYCLSTHIRHPCLTIFYICTKAVIIGNPLAASSNTKQSYFHIITFGEKDVSNLSKQCNMNLVLKKCQHLAVVKIEVYLKNTTKRFWKENIKEEETIVLDNRKTFPIYQLPNDMNWLSFRNHNTAYPSFRKIWKPYFVWLLSKYNLVPRINSLKIYWVFFMIKRNGLLELITKVDY